MTAQIPLRPNTCSMPLVASSCGLCLNAPLRLSLVAELYGPMRLSHAVVPRPGTITAHSPL